MAVNLVVITKPLKMAINMKLFAIVFFDFSNQMISIKTNQALLSESLRTITSHQNPGDKSINMKKKKDFLYDLKYDCTTNAIHIK